MFTPDLGTAAWVLTGALSLCTLVFIPTIGFLLAREIKLRDEGNKEMLKRIDGFAAMFDEVKGMIHETRLLISEHRLWASETFVPRPECGKQLQLIREDMRLMRGDVRDLQKDS